MGESMDIVKKALADGQYRVAAQVVANIKEPFCPCCLSTNQTFLRSFMDEWAGIRVEYKCNDCGTIHGRPAK